jgi:hypothetical protein
MILAMSSMGVLRIALMRINGVLLVI